MPCTSAGPVTLPFDERGGLIVLVDPGRSTPDDARVLAERAAAAGACGFLVGDSLGVRETISAHVAAIRRGAPEVPVVQFPASADDLTPDVDAILFLVLVSGRNPRYLIDEQVRAWCDRRNAPISKTRFGTLWCNFVLDPPGLPAPAPH